MSKLGFFLGAGAEVDYGFPSGFEFSKQIFSPSENQKKGAKEEFKKLYDNGTFSLPTNADLKKISKSIIEKRFTETKTVFTDDKNENIKENIKSYCDELFKKFLTLSDENQKS